MKKLFLGICILLSALLVSGTVLYDNFSNYNRYKVAGAKVFDTAEGKFIENQANITQETTVIANQSSTLIIEY